MELHYSKLNDKYMKLKAEKESAQEKLFQDLNGNYMKYISVAQEEIENLKNKNKRLIAELNDLKYQTASNRSKVSESIDYKKSLMEEREKTKMLLEEVEKLRNNNSSQMQTPLGVQKVTSQDFSVVSTRDLSAKPSTDIQIEVSVVKAPESCSRAIQPSSIAGGDSTASGDDDTRHADCLFQTLLECLTGMKCSRQSQEDGLSLSVLDQSSGYSFSLTPLGNTAIEGEDAELLYHILSLGTYERVAPAWMREDIIFTMRMCRIFFQRITQVIRSHC